MKWIVYLIIALFILILFLIFRIYYYAKCLNKIIKQEQLDDYYDQDEFIN